MRLSLAQKLKKRRHERNLIRLKTSYAKFKALGLCAKCGKKPLYINGAYCKQCTLKRKRIMLAFRNRHPNYDNEYYKNNTKKINRRNKRNRRKRYEYYRNYGNDYNKKKYYELKKKGVCVRCGKNKPQNGAVRCIPCIKRRKSYRIKRKKEIAQKQRIYIENIDRKIRLGILKEIKNGRPQRNTKTL